MEPEYTCFCFVFGIMCRISAVTPIMLTAISSHPISSYCMVQKLSNESVPVQYRFPSCLDSVVHNLSSIQFAPYQSYLDPVYIILRSPLRPSKWSCLGFPPKKLYAFFSAMHTTCQAYPTFPWFDNSDSSQRVG